MPALALALLLFAGQPTTPSPFVHRMTLQTQDYPGNGNHTVTVKTVVDAGKVVAWHTHPGLESAYVVSGSATLEIRDRPDATLRDGDSFAVPQNTPHQLTNTGAGPLTVVSTYVVDPSRPIAGPVN